MKLKYTLLLIFGLWICACKPDPISEIPPQLGLQSYSYLALGDSYTIGQGVDESARWPVQLADRLLADSLDLRDMMILAQTGWTTDELFSAIQAALDLRTSYDLVSLLIGVNNQFRGYPLDQYERELKTLLEKCLSFVEGNPERVFMLSIPDYGLTPFGRGGNPPQIAQELDTYNALADSLCGVYSIAFYDITEVTRQFGSLPEYVASDSLHPSGRMYEAWVEKIEDQVKSLIK